VDHTSIFLINGRMRPVPRLVAATINIQGMAYNFENISADATIKVIAQNGETKELYNQTVTIPAQGNYSFSATHSASTHSASTSFTLLGNLSIGTTGGNSSFSRRVTVAAPYVSASMTAPDIVGAEPFGVDLLLSNKGPTPADLVINANGDVSTLNISVGSSTMKHYSASTRENMTYYIYISGNATISLSKSIQYGIKMGISIPDNFIEGTREIPVNLSNSGPMDVNATMDFKLYRALTGEMVYSASKPFFLPGGKNNSTTIFLNYRLEKQDYILDYNSTVIQGTKAIHVAKLNDITAELNVSENRSGLTKVTANVSNRGLNDFNGSWTSNTSFYSETKDLNVSAGTFVLVEFYVPEYNIPGIYNLTFKVLADGNVIHEKNTEVTVYNPLFEMKGIYKDSNYTIGSRGALAFRVKNNGNAAGKAKLDLDIPGIYSGTNSSMS